MRRDPLLKSWQRAWIWFCKRYEGKNPRVEQKEASVGEKDISSIQIFGTKEEGTNCPQGYKLKGGKDGFWW